MQKEFEIEPGIIISKLDKLINQVKATDYKPYTLILTKEMIEKYEEYISHLGNVKILIQKERN